MDIQQWQHTLSEIIALDPEAFTALYQHRVPCTPSLADHPTVQVAAPKAETDHYRVGLLGILNGLFSVEHPGHVIALQIDDDTHVVIGVQINPIESYEKTPA